MKLGKFGIKRYWFGFILSFSRILVCTHKVWEKIHEYFSLQTKSHTRQLHTTMHAIKLGSKSREEYLLKIKNYVVSLLVLVFLCAMKNMLMLFGRSSIPFDYAPVVFVIESKKCTPSITEIEALLYGHETRHFYVQETQTLV